VLGEMIRLQNILNEMIARTLFLESKKLRVFDFDDTLAFTKSYIYVTDKNGNQKKLTPGQYAMYNERPGDKFDFRDFQSVKEPTELKKVTVVLKRILQKNSDGGVYILTARPQSVEPHIHQYLKDIGINQRIPVVGLESNNPKDKANWIENQIEKNKFDDVYFADDSIKNVNAVKDMLRTKNVKWRVQHIKH
jgi:predicted DNA-binding protein